MSIDPGMRYTGWAYWEDDELQDWGLVHMSFPKGLEWQHRAAAMAKKMLAELRYFTPAWIVCEFPQEMGGAGSRGDIALRSGSVRKLAAYVGMLEGRIAESMPDVQFIMVEPMTWKGQLPKEITLKRVLRDYPKVAGSTVRHDVIDAIGIGRWRVRESKKRRA